MGGCQGKIHSTSREPSQTRTKAPKSSAGLLKRPHQPDVVRKSSESEDLLQEVERLKEVCEARTRDLRTVHAKLCESNRGFEAMTVLVKYLTEDLDAFSRPLLARQHEEVRVQLTDARKQLDELVQLRNSLLQDRDLLQEDHKNELFRLAVSHRVELQTLEDQTKAAENRKHEEVLHQHGCEIRSLHLQQSHELTELRLKHSQDLEVQNQHEAETVARLELQLEERVEELEKSHKIQLEELSLKLKETEQKVDHLRAECQELREREKSCSATYERESETKVQSAVQYLEEEVKSLNVVVGLRNEELALLRQNNRQMEKQLEELPVARETINKLQQQIENLDAIINLKVNYERELSEKHQVLLRKYDREAKAKKRLSMDNEELVWRLSQSEMGSTPDVFRSSLSQLPMAGPPHQSVHSVTARDSHEPRQRPRSMVLLSPPTTPSGGDRPPTYRSSSSTGAVKLRKPRIFNSADHSLVSDMKLSEIKQSDV